MRIVFLSDTHLQHAGIEVPPGDLLIHSGDALLNGNQLELFKFNSWFRDLPHAKKIFVPGNHDVIFEKDWYLASSLMDSSITILHDKMTEVLGLKIYGAGWTPAFYNWAFNLRRGEEIAEKWKMIPEGLDILVTHGPPWGILDDILVRKSRWGVEDGAYDDGSYGYPDQMPLQKKNVGCEELAKRVKIVKPKCHVFGHIHVGYGAKEEDGTLYVNAAVCDSSYSPTQKPIVVDYVDGQFSLADLEK